MPVVANRNDRPTHKGHAPAALAGSPGLSVGPCRPPREGDASTSEPLTGYAGAFRGGCFVVPPGAVACQTGGCALGA